MGFFSRFKDVVSGRVAKSNLLLGNHAVRICGKLGDNETPLFSALVYGTSMCTIQFLESMLFDVEDFKYDHGTVELNPFKKNMNLLKPDNSYVMFKLVAGNFLVHLLAQGLLESVKDVLDVSELKRQFFTIYEYDDSDIKIFNELLEIAQKEEDPAQIVLYRYIFEKAFKIETPHLPFHTMNFGLVFVASFNEIFLPGLLEAIRK